MIAYVVARHAPGGLVYLCADDTWTRCRRCADVFDDKGLAAAIASSYAGGHVRDAYRHELTCRPVGRPRASA